MRKFRISIAAVCAAIGLAALATAPALASPAPAWSVYYYAPSQAALYVQSAGTSATFSFKSGDAYAARMTTSDQSLIGDKAGETISATMDVVNMTGSFFYNGQGSSWNPCGSPATVRFFFTSNSEAAGTPTPPIQAGGSGYPGVAYTHYWWSNPVAVKMDSINGTQAQLTTTITPDQWSDWDGQMGSTEADAFTAAASHIASIGVSFGGGCFFENGVVTTDGSGQFQLTGFSD